MWYTIYSKGDKHQMKGNDYYEKFYEKLKCDFNKRRQIAAIMRIYNDMLKNKNKHLMASAMNA